MTFSFAKFFSKLFPAYYRQNDTLQDVDGEGTLSRFVDTFGEAIDANTIPLVEDMVENILDAAECDSRFLNHIAYTLGNPPDVMNSEELYRKLLLHIVSIYKIKGTIPSYWYFFNLLGFSVVVTEYPCVDILYDQTNLYDDAKLYDKYCCNCSDYSLAFSSVEDNCSSNTYNSISQTTILNLLKVIFFLEPINARLRSLNYLIRFCDQVNWCYQDEFAYSLRVHDQYDIGLLYDDSEQYDSYIEIDSDSITNNSCSPNPNLGPFLLQENGDFLLQETFDKIIIEV